MLTKDHKLIIIKEFQLNNNDTCSYQVQIALMSTRVIKLEKHIKKNTCDIDSILSKNNLIININSMLIRLKHKDIKSYEAFIARFKNKYARIIESDIIF